MNEGAGAALFTLEAIDTSALIATITTNAPMIIGAGVAIILVKKAIPLVPQMISRIIK